MNEIIVLPYKEGNISGKVSVEKGSRIKVYRPMGGSIKGFLLGYDASGITILEPENYKDFDNIRSEGIKGRVRKIPLSQLRGYAFYPEVTVFETNEKETDQK
ncbi:MAG: hypothetical protein ACP5UZ_08105 [Thermoplasmata archaeon]